jgi:hypothetical protein
MWSKVENFPPLFIHSYQKITYFEAQNNTSNEKFLFIYLFRERERAENVTVLYKS